jgi:hypothetical protein
MKRVIMLALEGWSLVAPSGLVTHEPAVPHHPLARDAAPDVVHVLAVDLPMRILRVARPRPARMRAAAVRPTRELSPPRRRTHRARSPAPRASRETVVKHEALAVRRQRGESIPVQDVDLDGRAAEAQRPVDDLLEGRERVTRSAEALRRLKPDEAKALMLKAQGLSYREIGESLGWTYTKVNRCITEGRARFLAAYAEIEAGAECDRFAPTLAALVGGTASADALLELRPHIRNCATCRATVRDLHSTRLGRLTAVWPIPALLAPLRWVAARFGDGSAGSQTSAGFSDGRSASDGEPPGVRHPDAGDPTSTDGATDLYEVIARSQTSSVPAPEHARPRLVDWALQRAGDGVASAKQHAAAAYTRAADPTPLAGVRPGAAVAAFAGCLAIGGGTTLCVTQGVDPIGGLAHVVSPAGEHKRAEPRKTHAPRRRTAVSPTPTPAATPVAVATAQPAEPSPQPTAEASPQPTPTPTPAPAPEDEYEPVVPATAAGSSPPAPPKRSQTRAPAPAGGPGEFDGP